jgi:hypothetical protein
MWKPYWCRVVDEQILDNPLCKGQAAPQLSVRKSDHASAVIWAAPVPPVSVMSLLGSYDHTPLISHRKD